MNYNEACNKINELSGGFKPEIIAFLLRKRHKMLFLTIKLCLFCIFCNFF